MKCSSACIQHPDDTPSGPYRGQVPLLHSRCQSQRSAIALLANPCRNRSEGPLSAILVAPGILSLDDGAGFVATRETAADRRAIPLWGHAGDFIIKAAGMAVRIENKGKFGIGAGWRLLPMGPGSRHSRSSRHGGFIAPRSSHGRT